MDVKGASKPLLILAVSAATLAGIGGYAWYESRRPAVLELFVFDTPGAPAILIRTPHDRRILIDGGANADVIKRLSDELPFYSRRIDIIIATKADAKNVTGLIDVLNRYQVDKAVLPSVTLENLGLASSSDPAYEIFKKTLIDLNINTEEVAAGKRLILDPEVTADVIFPESDGQFEYSKASVPEILLRIDYGRTSIVLAGSASVKIQKHIATHSNPADVLIFSHSITPSNVSQELIDSIAPDYLVYSQAITKTPAKSKAQADPLAGILNDHRFNVRETGVVKVVSDGHSLEIKKTP